MADISFDDLIPQKAASPSQISFDDLIPGGDKKPSGGVMETLANGARALRTGLPFSDRLVAGAQTLYNGKDYSTNLADERAKDAQLFQDHRVLANLGKGTGSLAVPVGSLAAIPNGASLGIKALVGAGTGGAIGGVQGLSDAPDWTNASDTAKHVAQGTLGGTLVGGTMPVMARGIGLGYNAMADAVRGGASGISSAAASHILPAFTADNAINPVAAQIQKLGPEAMLGDAGPALLGKAQGAYLNSDAGRAALGAALAGRKAGANGRIQNAADTEFGPAPQSAQNVNDTLLSQRSAQDNVNYPKALDNAPPVDTSGVLATVGQKLNDAVPGTMEHKALSNMKNMLMGEKQVPVLDPMTGRPVLDHAGQPVTQTVPDPRDNARQLHKIKDEIDNIIHYDAPGLGVPAGALKNQQGALKLIRGELNGTLEGQVPGYAQANAASSALAKQAEAVPLGTSLLDSGKTALTPADLVAKTATMSPEEKAAMAQGLRHEVERNLDTKKNDLVAGNNVIKGDGDWNRERLATVFGQGPTDRFINTMDTESVFANTHKKVVEDSQSAMRTAAAASMKPSPATETPLINPNMTVAGTIGTIGKKLLGSAINSMRGDPTAAHAEVARILAAQGPQRDAHISALVDALTRRESNAKTATKVGDRAALAAALLGNAYQQHLQQNQSR